MSTRGADRIVQALLDHRVETVFGLPGVHNLALWEALRATGSIRLVGVRHEQAAVYAADGLARASGSLGVALTTTGPGAANAVAATGEAYASRSPVLVIATDIPTTLRRDGVVRGALHETRDQPGLFRSVVHAALRAGSAEEVAPLAAEAVRLAMAARRPVYLEVPTDLLAADAPPAPASSALASASEAVPEDAEQYVELVRLHALPRCGFRMPVPAALSRGDGAVRAGARAAHRARTRRSLSGLLARRGRPGGGRVKIVDLIGVPVRSGFFRDDQESIRAGAAHDGFLYAGPPATPGFRSVREAGRAVSVMLLLDDGRVAMGDCAEVQYVGVGGRSELLDHGHLLEEVDRVLRPALVGRELAGFRPLSEEIDMLTPEGRPMSLPLRYGISQALLDASAQAAGLTMAEVVRDEYATGVELAPVPIYAQSGDDRYDNVDKMILKHVDVLPHGLINTIDGKLGRRGELLLDYVGWVRDRILQLGAVGYEPVLHIDVYGTVGLIFGGDLDAVATYLARLGKQAAPFRFRIEHPVDAGDREGQIAAYVALRGMLASRGSRRRAGGRRVVQHPGRHPRLRGGRGRRHDPGQDTGPRRCRQHDRGAARGPARRHRRVLWRDLQRDRRARHGSARTSRWPVAPTRCWPSPAWAWTRDS